MEINISRLFSEPCGFCAENSGKATYYYCANCGGTTEGCATCKCASRRPVAREENCRVCHGRGSVPSALGTFPELKPGYAKDILFYKERKVSPADARRQWLNGPVACWYCPDKDGWEIIFQRLLRGGLVILDIQGKLIPMSLRPWDCCFD